MDTSQMRDAWAGTGRLTRAVLLAAGVVVGYVVVAAVLPQGAPLPVVGLGLIQGAASALTALGLILIWRSNRFINFAYGAMGAATGATASQVFLSWGWPYWSSLALGLVGGITTGVLVEMLVIRRFQNSSRLILTVASIGLAQVLGGIEIILPQRLFDDQAITLGGYKTPLSDLTWSTSSVLFLGDHLLVLVVVPIVMAALALFFSKHRAGVAIRAAAENDDRARLLGIPTRRLQTLVWAIAGGLATLTFLLTAPFAGSPPTAGAGPALLLPALAAAVVARMESFQVAVVAALGIGVMDQVVRWNADDAPSLPFVFLLLIILAALMIQRGRSRAYDLEETWQDGATATPVPTAIAALPEVRAVRYGLWAVVLMAILAVGLWGSVSFVNGAVTTMVWGLVAVSLVVLTGWGGQVSLGQFGLVGVGAMVAGNMMMRWNLDLVFCMFAAALAGGLVALVLGLPALRIRGPFLGVVTLTFAVVLDGYVLNPSIFPALVPDNVPRPVLWGKLDLADEKVLYALTVAVLVLAVFLARGLRNARSGRALIASRDNRKSAEAMAVAPQRTLLGTFVFSGVLCGIAGTLQVVNLMGARAQSFPVTDSIEVFSMATIGGLGSILGAISGVVGVRGAIDAVSDEVRLVVSGAGLLLVLWLLPGGFAAAARWLRDRLLSMVARRRGMVLDGTEPDPVASPAPGPAYGQVDPHALLTCKDVCVSYGHLQVLFDVDFSVREGEMVALLGTNGAGKSTLLKAVVGLVSHKGSVQMAGEELSGLAPGQIVGRRVALMSGGKSIFPTLTVREHFQLVTWTFHSDSVRIRDDMEAVLERFPALIPLMERRAGDLSGGEQQQLALGQTMMLRPDVLLIDELSLGLSPVIVSQLLNVVRELNSIGVTIVVVEQSVNVALTLAERAVFMEKGAVRFEGPTRELLDRPDVLRSVFLQGASALESGGPDGVAPESAMSRELHAALGSLGDGEAGPVGLSPVQPTRNSDSELLVCEGVVKTFGGVLAVDNVDLKVEPGEIVGLVGQNGAGKTTLLDCVSGFHDIDRGRIVFRGYDVSDWSPFERARGRLGRSFQEARLFPSLTVAETIAVARERMAECRSVVADVTWQPASFESELQTRRRVEELIAMFGLGGYANKPISDLSTGTRRVVELACLLAEEPVLLLLDEPSAGVAQKETEALGPLLKRIRDHTGAGMLVIEHDMPLLSGLCDRMIALELGAVIAAGTPQEVLTDEHVVASYLGTDTVAISRSGAVPG